MVRGVVAGALAAALLHPGSGAAQAIVGTVTEGGSDRPVTGAMVRLFTGDGPAGPRFLTADDGRYRIRVARPGTYWLQVERIGFAETRRGPVEVPEDGTVTVDVVAVPSPVRLEALDVETLPRSCALEGEAGDRTQLVWDEARKALAAATWTEREEGLRFTLEQRVRRLDPTGGTVADEERHEIRVVGGNSVRSLPPEDLASGGYVREVDGLVYYYGPDAEALLSDAFLRTHCFQVVPGPHGEPDLLGLSFEPVPERDTTDIAGLLLLDRATARLDRVEFRYTGLHAEPGRDQARGMVRFLELGDGRWVVREWFIRAPVLTLEPTVGAGGRLVDEVVVGSVQEFGSRVSSVEGRAGVSWRPDRPLGGVRGVVHDSIRGEALAEAEVRLAGRGWLTRADASGRWSLEEIPPGRYRVTFSHPRLDSLGVEPGWTEVAVEPGSVTEVPLAVPPLGRLLARACPDPSAGVVVGLVRDAAGRALPGVQVVVAAGIEEGEELPGAVTDGDGSFHLCGLPAGREVGLEAVLGPVRSGRGVVRTVAGSAVRVDLDLTATAEIRTRVEPGAGRATLEGVVVEVGSGEPVEGVVVELSDPEGGRVGRGVTGPEGGFRIRPGRPGAYLLATRHLAYGPVEGREVEVGEGIRRVEIRLAPRALETEGVVVEVAPRSRQLELAGFYERRAQGMGLLLDREALDRMNLTETGDIVHRVAGLATVPQTTRGSMDSGRRFLMFRRAARASGCMPAIFVDGNQIRQGGRWHQGLPSLDEIIPADEVQALELYDGPASLPPRFSSMGAACGAIVIWSRSPEPG